MRIEDLDTPCLLLDRGRLESNLAAMSTRMQGHGVDLRPHMKTAKSIDVARLALGDGNAAITVSTLNEAAYFAQHGIQDILYAVCISPQKLGRAAEFLRRGVELKIITDNEEMAAGIAARGSREDVCYPVLIEIDSGEGRTGIACHDENLIQIATILQDSPHTRLMGVLTHGGHAYMRRTRAEVRAVAEQERRAVVHAATRLREAGFSCPLVSAGSTPTAVQAASLEGVTEMRPGVYMFGDLFQAQIGSCRMEDIALSVLATVIGHQPRLQRLMIDAGALALSKDRSTAQTDRDLGYGLAMDEAGRILEPEMVVSGVHQEHGELTAKGALPFSRFPVGTRLRILPNHACMTAAMFSRYHVTEAGSREVVAVWPRTNGWDLEKVVPMTPKLRSGA